MTFNLDGSDELTDEEFDRLITHLKVECIDLMKQVLTPEETQHFIDSLSLRGWL